MTAGIDDTTKRENALQLARLIELTRRLQYRDGDHEYVTDKLSDCVEYYCQMWGFAKDELAPYERNLDDLFD